MVKYAVGNSDQNYTKNFLKFLSEKSKTIKFLVRIFHFLEYTTSGLRAQLSLSIFMPVTVQLQMEDLTAVPHPPKIRH